jgi:hypothetical protein
VIALIESPLVFEVFMAEPFTQTDYIQLITVLKLSPDAITEGSLLRSRCEDLELFDSTNGTDFVGDVQTAILDWVSANCAKQSAMTTDTSLGIKSQRVDGEYSIEYSDRGGISKYDGYEIKKRASEATIIRLLQWDSTSRYISFNTRANA